MKRINTKKLPPIFKMSVLCNILPYYGHIHRWRRLLEKINTETKEIWDQNRDQLMHIGRDFKRDIELDNLKEFTGHLRPNRSWLDLFVLSLSYRFQGFEVDFTNLIKNLNEDEVIIIDSHDDIFKGYQIHFCSKDRISDILPAIKCPKFKSEIMIPNTNEINKISQFIYDQNNTKSKMIEKTDYKLCINLVYDDIIKITPRTFCSFHQNKLFDKLKKRYKLCKIDDCVCKPKKIRVLVDDFKGFRNTIEDLEKASNINDVKLGILIKFKSYGRFFSNYDTIVFNHSVRRMSDKESNFIFTGKSLTVASEGNYYNFILDQRTTESEDSYIKGKI